MKYLSSMFEPKPGSGEIERSLIEARLEMTKKLSNVPPKPVKLGEGLFKKTWWERSIKVRGMVGHEEVPNFIEEGQQEPVIIELESMSKDGSNMLFGTVFNLIVSAMGYHRVIYMANDPELSGWQIQDANHIPYEDGNFNPDLGQEVISWIKLFDIFTGQN